MRSTALLLLAPAFTGACTTVLLKTAKDGCTVIGRTMELGIPETASELEKIYLHARGSPIMAANGSKHNASRFGYLAVQFTFGSHTFPSLGTTEGINEAGLTVSAQVHVGASYEPVSAAANKSLTLLDVQATAFLLACCASVDEAAAALRNAHVVATPVVGSIGTLHWSVQDASGKSAAFEYIDESLHVFDNTEVGVLTNDPSYEWQLGHLNLYAGYSSANRATRFAPTASSSGPFSSSAVNVHTDGSATHITTTTVPTYYGHGLNTRGLPSSYAPPDRFAKMFLLKQTAMGHAPPSSLDEGIVVITGLLNTVHIVRGTVTGESQPWPYEYTNWAAVKVPRPPANSSSGPLFFYRTYDNMQWKRIELGRIEWAVGATHKPIPLYESGLGVKDVTPA